MAGEGDKSGLELVTHYVRTSNNPPDHIFLDEAPLEVKVDDMDKDRKTVHNGLYPAIRPLFF